jgi:hypothetical protein
MLLHKEYVKRVTETRKVMGDSVECTLQEEKGKEREDQLRAS